MALAAGPARAPEGSKRAVAAWGRAKTKLSVMATVIAPLSGWRGDSVREAVEAALDAEDITLLVRAPSTPGPPLAPLGRALAASAQARGGAQVRMVFDASGKAAAAEAAPREDADEDGSDREGEGRPARQAPGGSASAVLAMLQRVAEEQAAEISQIARCAPAADRPVPGPAGSLALAGEAGAGRHRLTLRPRRGRPVPRPQKRNGGGVGGAPGAAQQGARLRGVLAA